MEKRIKKTPLLLGIIIFIMLITGGIVSATTWGTFKQNSEIDLVMICPLVGCNQTNITAIINPNSATIVSNELATHDGNVWNYTLNNTGTIGEYKVYGYSTNGTTGAEEYFIGDFEVTPSGFVGTLGFYILVLILSLGIIVLGYYAKDAWVVVFGAFGFVLLGLFIILYGIDGIKDTYYTWGIGILTIGLASYFGIKGAIEEIGF